MAVIQEEFRKNEMSQRKKADPKLKGTYLQLPVQLVEPLLQFGAQVGSHCETIEARRERESECQSL